MPRNTASRYNDSDLLYAPSEGYRYEIVDGELFVDGSPSRRAHRAGIELGRTLWSYFVPRGFDILHAPHDVVGRHLDAVFPAIVVDRSLRSDPGSGPAPVLVIEFLSSKGDFRATGLRCAQRGIEHYWEIDANEPLMTCWSLEDGVYRLRVPWVSSGTLAHPDFEGLVIDVGALWDGPPDA